MTNLDLNLLDRYLAGACSAQEREDIELWIAADPANDRWVRGLHHVLAEEAARTAARTTIKRQIAAERPVRSHWAMIAKLAAAVALVVGAGLAVWTVTRPPRGAGTVAERVLTTPPGQRASFQLPDGTQVMLGVASTLRHAMTLDGGSREVRVEGEAYFKVVHDERRPFVVRAGDIVATDLGTEFVVRAYPEDGHARVVVREGTVALRAAAARDTGAVRVLGPGDLGRLSLTGEPVAEPADTSALFAWTDGWLVFTGTPLRDALPQLSRWYDLDFRLADSSLGDIRLSASLRNRPTAEALDLLANSLGLRQDRRGRVVTFFR